MLLSLVLSMSPVICDRVSSLSFVSIPLRPLHFAPTDPLLPSLTVVFYLHRHWRQTLQMSILWRSVCSQVRPLFICSRSPLNLSLLVTFYPDTSTNVTQMKNHYLLQVFVGKVLPLPREQLHQNKSATSVFRQTLLVMVLTLAVSPCSLYSPSQYLFSNLAKCVQRKYRCTFVKFHRQTAPVGPGHNIRQAHETSDGPPSPNPMTASSPSSRMPMYHHQSQQAENDFLLAPPPTVVPTTMADALYGTTPFTFPPLYPANDMSADNTDYVTKYRAHTELFASARSGMSTAPASSSTGLSPSPLYDSRGPSSWLGWGQQDAATDPYHHHQHQHSAHPPPSLSSSMNGNHPYLTSLRYA